MKWSIIDKTEDLDSGIVADGERTGKLVMADSVDYYVQVKYYFGP